ncbi:MAG TPA: sodium/proton-translocating pyrophosphatase, partial [Candidatus Methanomethylophilaceae archaeon]|nr:sodium/proton-translocating pyrophosphatase [Candidatus Methanomethylophilaceae archaeon]
YLLPVEMAIHAPAAMGALMMVATIVGLLMANFLNNGGGAWDNAKKYIESGKFGGKGSYAHEAAIVGDTVGDPFKDTAGPSIHVLIKLLPTICMVTAVLYVI